MAKSFEDYLRDIMDAISSQGALDEAELKRLADEKAAKEYEAALEKWKAENEAKNLRSNANTAEGYEAALEQWKAEQQSKLPKNQGGFAGGMEYLGTKIVDGLISSVEHGLELGVSGFADLIGQDEYAEKIQKRDWFDYEAADRKFNPGAGWKFAGNVSSAIGGALPEIGVGMLLGGLGKVAQATASVAMTLGTSGGQALSDAVKTTGELGEKEWKGGLLAGGVSAGIEGVSSLIGGAIDSKSVGKTFAEMGGEVVESFGKKGKSEAAGEVLGYASRDASTLWGKVAAEIFSSKTGKELFGEMLSEAGEEGLEAILEPIIQQNTYNPNAPSASFKDVLYSAAVGGLTGGLMRGGTKVLSSGIDAVSSSINTNRGAKISQDSGKLSALLNNAKIITNYEVQNKTGSEVFEAVQKLYDKVQAGVAKNSNTVEHYENVALLERGVARAVVEPSLVEAAIGVATNAGSMTNALNEYYARTGQDRVITAEQLTEGLVLNQGNKKLVRSVTKALQNNALLREVVVNNALGRYIFEAQNYANSIFDGAKISDVATQENINRFLAGADAQTLAKVGEALGITNWATVTPDELAQRLRLFRESGMAAAYEGGVNAIQLARGTDAYTNGLPSGVRSLTESVTRFKSEGVDIAIIKEGGGYRLYDFESGHVTRVMSESEMDALVQRIKDKQVSFKEQSEMQRLDKELHDFAVKEIPEYKKLTTSEREVVRETLRFAKEYGASKADQILFGRISAKSGLAIHLTDKVPGGDVAFFDGKNTIYLDANAPRTRSYKGLLGHEVWHKMFKSPKVKGLFQNALNNIDPGKRAEVKETYIEDMRQSELYTEEIANISDEEVAAAYAEELFNEPHVWDIVLDGEPTLKDRVLAFFKLAPKKYSFAPEMDPAAKEWITEYKKLFDEISAESKGEVKVIGRVLPEGESPSVKVIGRVVEDNGLEPNNNTFGSYNNVSGDSDNVKTTNQQKTQDGGRSAKNSNQSKFYEDKYYQRQIDRIDELKQGSYITVGEIPTGSPLNMVGFPSSIVYFDVSKIIKEMRTRKDVVSAETMKAIPQVLNNPVVITEFVDEKGEISANVYGQLYVSNSPVVVGVMMKQTPKGNIVNKIKTVHPNRSVLKEMTDDKILYLSENKKETKSWFQSLGKQVLPLRGKQFGFIRSISQNSQNDKGFDKNSSKNVDSGGRAALSDSKKATSSDVARVKGAISEAGIDPRGIMALSDSYFDRYDGSLTRTGLRYEFLDAARTMLQSDSDAYDRAFAKIEAIAEELTINEKDGSGFSNDLREIQSHIREITFALKDQDKGEFDSLGGFNEFRKKHFGKLKIANEGASVDSVYGELQTLYGLSLFPDQNTAQEMLIQIADVLDMDPKAQTGSDIDLKAAGADMAVEITQKIVNAFENKLAAKTARMSKADAEAYKARINARAETKAAKAIARAKKRLEAQAGKIKAAADKKIATVQEKTARRLESEQSRLRAEYETDTVFSESGIGKELNRVEAFRALTKDRQKDYARRIYLEMNKSDGRDWRRSLEIQFTVEIANEIMMQPDGKYDFTNILDRRRLNEELSLVMQDIAGSGRKSTKAKLEGEIRGELTTQIKAEESARRIYLSEIYQSLKKIDDVKSKRFLAASDYHSAEFKSSIEALTKMDWRGQLNDNIVRSQMEKLSQWYRQDNPMLQEFKQGELETTYFDPGIANRLEILSEGVGELSGTELEMLSDTVRYFTKLINEYDMVYVEGKWQSGEDLVYEMRDNIEKQDKLGVPLAIRGLRNKFLTGGLRTFGDPLSVIKLCDMYENGIFTRIYNDWTKGEINAEADSLLVKEEYDAFLKKNRFYLAGAEKNTVNLHGTEINHLQLVEYLMTLKRKGSWLGIASEGIVISGKDGRDVSIRPIAPISEGRDYNKRLEAAIKSEYDKAAGKLSSKDREYMQILERAYVKAGEIKAAGDMNRLGFANVVEGYYYPIKRAYTEHLSEFESELFAVDRYANASFNKRTIDKAKAALRIGSADSTFNRHVKGVTRYMHLSPVMDSFNKLYKLKALKTKPGIGADISALMKLQGSTFSLQSLIAQSRTAWRVNDKVVGFDYLQNLMLDTMGRKQSVGDEVAGRFRSGYVGFALGGNPKVIMTQFSSLLASTSVLHKSSYLKGTFNLRRGMDNYSVVARLRDSDYTIAKSQAVVDNISSAARFFTMGMSLADRFVVYRAWGACQAEAARKGGPKVGTEENLRAAGKLLDKVILETQQNSFASRKTEGARRGNMLTKTMLMFKSDAITTFGRVIDAWGETAYLQARLKGTKGDERASINSGIKASKDRLSRAVLAVTASSLYMLLVSELFRSFYGKNDEEEKEGEKWFRRLGEFVGNLLGGIPVVSEIYSFFTSGYELSTMEFSAINDLLDTAKSIWSYGEKLISGRASERDGNRMIEKLLYGAGQLFGIPFRNLKNVSFGFTRLLSPESAYRWNAALYSQSYGSDLMDAIEKGDMQMAAVILELAFGEKMGSGLSDKARDELIRLSGLGESVIPTAVGESVSINGEEKTLTGSELSEIREKYAEAIDRINELMDSKLYKSFTDEQKADAIRKICTLYKNLAYDSVVGTEKDRKAFILSKVVDDELLCSAEILSVIQSDKDQDGETVEGSKRKKVIEAIMGLDCTDQEKLLLIGMNGYTLASGDIPGMSSYEAKDALYDYIEGLSGINEEERLELYEACGFEVKGNQVILKQPSTSDFDYEMNQGEPEDAKEIFSLVVTDRLGSSFSEGATNELIRLAGLSELYRDRVMPSAISGKLTVNGSERELSAEEISAIKEKYGEAGERIDAFIGSALYKSYTDEEKSAAIGKIFDLYKNIGYDSVLGTEKDADGLLLSKVVSGDVLCAFASLGVISSDKDSDGQTIAGSKRAKVVDAIGGLDISDQEKLLLIAMKGYALKDEDLPGVTSYQAKVALYNYIGTLELSDKEKLDLYRACGFDIVDGVAERPKASSSASSSEKRDSFVSLVRGGSFANRNGRFASIAKNRVRRIGKVIS